MEKQTKTENDQRSTGEQSASHSAAELAHKERVRTSAARVSKNHADAIKRLADR